MITGILLAAGRSERFGSDKRLHDINGKPLVYYGLQACVESALPCVHVVGQSRAQTQSLVDDLFPNHDKIRVVEQSNPELGLMSSVKAGLRALPSDVDGAMIVLADMPLVTPVLINQLSDVFNECGTVVVAENGGQHYHPKILPRSLFSQFLALGDHERGTAILDALGDSVTTVHVPDASMFRDIDRPDDLAEVTRRLATAD